MRPRCQATTYWGVAGLVQAICKEKGVMVNGGDDNPGQIRRLVRDDPGRLGDKHIQGSEGNGLVGCILGR